MTFPVSRQGLEQVALFFAAGAAIFAVLSWWAHRNGEPWRRNRISAGALAGLAAVALLLGYTIAPNIPTPPVPLTARFATNPVPDTQESWDAGRATYQKNCAVCHGPRALGDGPAAFTLNPRPFNLQLHAPLHAPGEVYYWISTGVAGTAMPAWQDRSQAPPNTAIPDKTLSDTERWQLVRYIYALAAGRAN